MDDVVLPPQDEEKVKEFVDQLLQRRSDATMISYGTAVKFLLARKLDVKRAVDLYISHQDVRQREGLTIVDPKDPLVRRELLSEKFTVLQSRDQGRAAIALFTARHHNPAKSSHQVTLQGLVFQLDTALASLETQYNGLVFIYDMTNAKYSNFDYELNIKVLNLLKGSYPARLKKVLIVTAPLWFKAPFKILRLFVKEKLRDRVFTVKQNQLTDHIPAASLPRHLGGKLEANHHAWITQCLQQAWGHGTDVDDDIRQYLESDSSMQRSTSSLSSGNSSMACVGDDGNVMMSSDFDSERSHTSQTLEQLTLHSTSSSLSNGDSVRYTDSTSGDGRLTSVPSDTSSILLDIDVPPPPPPHQHASSALHPGGAGEHLLTSPQKRVLSDASVEPPSSDGGVPLIPSKKRPIASAVDKLVPECKLHVLDNGYSIYEFLEVVRIKGRKGLIREYADIKGESPTGSFDVSKSKVVQAKNRYSDVLCLDHSRVRLTTVVSDEPYADYINANFVDGYKQRNAYISTQGPLPKTYGDFWRMVWEQRVLVIIMATRTVERGRVKCGQYWPADAYAEEQYDNFIVVTNSVERSVDCTVTELILSDIETGETRQLTHFQFTSWPDYGVPHSAEAFLLLMHRVRARQAELLLGMEPTWTGHPLGPPIVVHCSAGIGRTGTFLTVDISTRQLDDGGLVDVQQTVRAIRQQRAFSIQMPDQYVFSHMALLEYAFQKGLIADISCDGFDEDSDDESDT